MTPAPDDRLDRANQLFSDALELSAPDRPAFVERECGADAELCQSVLRLLQRFDNLGNFLERPASNRAELSTGDVLDGRFRIVELLGRGGMGEVYRADDETLGEPVALKLVRAEWRTDPVMIARFHDEVRLARRISHPNVCRVFNFRTCGFKGRDLAFFEMEFLDGESLAKALATRGKFECAAVLRIAEGLAAGLDAAHREGVIHRDLKPGNILLARDRFGNERVVITDFGLARSVEDGDGSLTHSGILAGSPDYMAPEQYMAETLTPAADIFALGLIIYEMAAGTRPYPQESIVRAAVRRVVEAPAPLSRTAAGCPRHWDRVLSRALARDPARRPSSARELVQELAEQPSGVTAVFSSVQLPRVSRRKWLAAAGTAAAVVAVPLVYRRRPASAHIKQGAAVLVAPFENSTGDPQLDGAGDLLRGQLQQSAFFNVVSQDRVRFLLDRMTRDSTRDLDANTAREAAWRGGIPLVVFGSLARLGGELVFDLRMEVIGDRPDRPKARPNYSVAIARREGIFNAVAESSRWIRKQAGEAESSIQETDRPPEDVTTASWKALTLMHEALRRRVADKEEEALLLLKEAVREDPDFALAYMRLADISFSLYRYEDGYGYWKSALACMRKGRLTLKEQLRIEGLYAEDMGDWPGAERAFGEFAAHYPNDPLPWFYWGSVLLHLTKAEAARTALLRSEAIDPDSANTAYKLGQCALLSGRFEELARYTRKLRALNYAASADAVDGFAAFLGGSYAKALALFGGLKSVTDSYWRSESHLLSACVLAELGKYTDAIGALEQGAIDTFASGRLTARAERLVALGSLHLRRGDAGECQTAVRQALKLEHGMAQDEMAGVLLIRSGARSEADSILRRIAALGDTPGARAAICRLRGEIALVEGQAAEAVKNLGEAARLSRRDGDDSYFGVALARAGQQEQAAEVFRRIAESPAVVWMQPEKSMPGAWSDALFEYARVLAKLKRPDAKALLERFYKVRSAADAGLQQMEDARRLRDVV